MSSGPPSKCKANDERQKCVHHKGLPDFGRSDDLTCAEEKKRCSISNETKKTGLCYEKCNCYLTETLIRLKTKITENSRTLDKIAASNDEVRCNVELRPSEEKLFRMGIVKDDSVVCCVLVRQLRAQKRDLEAMLDQWVEFIDKTDRFRCLVTHIRDKLGELAPRIESILREAKLLEEIELENEEARRREIDEELRRSETRREMFRKAVDQCAKAEADDHLEQLARREKLDVLDRDKVMDRSALKPALRKMIKSMAAEYTQASAKNNKTILYVTPENNRTKTLRTAVENASPVLCRTGVSSPNQSQNNDYSPPDKRISFQQSDRNRRAIFRTRTKARRPF